jgi:hypothetical protein
VDRELYEPGRKVLKVPSSGMRYHEDYDYDTLYNDIGVLELTEPVELNGKTIIGPCLTS